MFHGFSWCFYEFLSISQMWPPTRFFWMAFCHSGLAILSSFLRSSKTPEIVATLGWVETLPFESQLFESQLIWTAGTSTDWF